MGLSQLLPAPLCLTPDPQVERSGDLIPHPGAEAAHRSHHPTNSCQCHSNYLKEHPKQGEHQSFQQQAPVTAHRAKLHLGSSNWR